mgnify:CR=1 FL=1
MTEAEPALERWAERWDTKAPTISPRGLAAGERLPVLCDSPPALRRGIATPNASEAWNYTLRQRLKTRGGFPNDEALGQGLSWAWQQVTTQWPHPMRAWQAALNQCGLLFGERVPM